MLNIVHKIIRPLLAHTVPEVQAGRGLQDCVRRDHLPPSREYLHIHLLWKRPLHRQQDGSNMGSRHLEFLGTHSQNPNFQQLKQDDVRIGHPWFKPKSSVCSIFGFQNSLK